MRSSYLEPIGLGENSNQWPHPSIAHGLSTDRGPSFFPCAGLQERLDRSLQAFRPVEVAFLGSTSVGQSVS